VRISKLAGKIAVGELALMEHRLRVAAGIVEICGSKVDHWTHGEINKCISQVAVGAIHGLTAHVASIPEEIEEGLAECAGLLSAFERSLSNVHSTRPHEIVLMAQDGGYYIGLASRLASFRKALCDWSGASYDDLDEAVAVAVRDAEIRALDEMERYYSSGSPSN